MNIIDSHTEGEPTRVLIEASQLAQGATMAERRDNLQRNWDYLRTAITSEPRGSEGAVVAFLTAPVNPGSVAGVIFANRTKYIGMCGHGSIGVVQTLAHLGRIAPADRIALDTPVGTIHAERFEDGSVEIQNVQSYAYRLNVTIEVPEVGQVTGDIGYGGNWFFLVNAPDVRAENIQQLSLRASRIRAALLAQGVTGENSGDIDHIELFGAPQRPDADSKNFVYCPDGAYDRSPCGTGTSAKMAILSARGELQPGEVWRQESIIGSLFTGRFAAGEREDIIPFIRGRAFILGEATLYFDPADPFQYGIPHHVEAPPERL